MTLKVDGMALDQFWECPKCGAQAAMGSPAVMRPPTCSLGHAATESEQVAEGRFGRFEDQDAGS
jgi:hypothetical protein